MFKFLKNILSKPEGYKEYQDLLHVFLNDTALSENQKSELEDLARFYNILDSDLRVIHKKEITNVFKAITSDGIITEIEKAHLEDLMSYFGFARSDFGFNQKEFNKCYTLGLIENGELPKTNIPTLNLILKKDEFYHWGCEMKLKQFKKVNSGASYRGLSSSVKIAKGVRYRIGSYKVSSNTREELKVIDNGLFWLTNQRVGFQGTKKSFSMPYTKIHSFELTKDGIYLFKDGRESPFIMELDDYDVPCLLISTILNS
ncbi:hypothetical protein [uncultured Arcticibacterium sp.]|uniref:hypothetical protein n=1 Tax=uncultured Arcticibacterium sp. TaxID=2173042 RepID=UPI0030F91721